MLKIKEFISNIFKNKKHVVILCITVAVVILAASVSWLVLANKPARRFYLEAEAKNFKKFSDQIKQIYKDFYSYQEPYLKSIHKDRLEIKADISSDGASPFGIENAASIFDIVGRCKLISDTQRDPRRKESITELELSFEGAPVIDATAYTKDRELNFTVPVLLPDKYLRVDLEKAQDVYKRFNIPFGPSRILRLANIAEVFRFSNEELDGVSNSYAAFFTDLIADEDVKYDGKAAVIIDGRELKGRKLVLTLDESKTERLVKGLAEKMAADDVLMRLTYENLYNIAKLTDETGLLKLMGALSGNEQSDMNFSEMDIEAFKKSIRNLASGDLDAGKLVMELIIDNRGNILDRKLNLEYSYKGSEYVLDLHTADTAVKDDNFKNSSCSILISGIEDGGKKPLYDLGAVTHTTPSGKEREKGVIELGYADRRTSSEGFKVSVRLDTDKGVDELTGRKNNRLKYDIRISDNEVEDMIDGELATISWKNDKLKTRNEKTEFIINGNMPSVGLDKSMLKLDVAREVKFDSAAFSLPEVSASSTIDLNTMTDSEQTKLEKDLLMSFGIFYLQNKPVMDALFNN